jgi:hypothetical protein
MERGLCGHHTFLQIFPLKRIKSEDTAMCSEIRSVPTILFKIKKKYHGRLNAILSFIFQNKND